MSVDHLALVAKMSEAAFADVIASSPRKIRETLFGRLGIKAKKRSVGLRVHGKLEERTKKLHARLKEASSKQESDLCEELVRNWLYTKRELLKDTLDFLGVENDNGLIDEEPTFFQELEKEKVQALVEAMKDKGHAPETIEVYLRYVEVAHADEVFGS